jgi:hypothetical protein
VPLSALVDPTADVDAAIASVSIVFAAYGEYCDENGVEGYQAEGGDRRLGYLPLTTDARSHRIAAAEDSDDGTRRVSTTFNDEKGSLACVVGSRPFLASSGVTMKPGATKCDLEFDLKALHRQLDVRGGCKRDHWFPYLDLYVDVSSAAQVVQGGRLEFSETAGGRLTQSASLDRVGRFGARDVSIHLEPSTDHHPDMPMPVPERLPQPNRVIRVAAALDVTIGEVRATKVGTFLYDPSAGYEDRHYRFRTYKETKECLVPEKGKAGSEYEVKESCDDDDDASHRTTSVGQLVHDESNLCMERQGDEIVLADCIVTGNRREQQWQLRKRTSADCGRCGGETDVGNLWHQDSRRCVKAKKGSVTAEDPGRENCDDDDHYFFFDEFRRDDDDGAGDCVDDCVDDRDCEDESTVGGYKSCVQHCIKFCK